MELCKDCEEKRKASEMKDALSDLETEIIALQDIADIVRTLDEMPVFLAWCVVERAEKLRGCFTGRGGRFN